MPTTGVTTLAGHATAQVKVRAGGSQFQALLGRITAMTKAANRGEPFSFTAQLFARGTAQ